MREQVFIKLYLDEDVSVLLASLIRARGFEAVTTLEAGNLGASDEASSNLPLQTPQSLLHTIELILKCLLRNIFLKRKITAE